MAIEAIAAVAAKEVAIGVTTKEAALQAAREIAQKMVNEVGAQKAGSELQTAMMERQAMQEGFRIGEMPENKGEGHEVLKEKEASAAEDLRGKLEEGDYSNLDVQNPNNTDLQLADGKNLEFGEKQDNITESFKNELGNNLEDETINNSEATKQLPKENGNWTGERGNSEWKPYEDFTPQKSNPEGKTWKEIFENESTDRIPFKNGEPDFSAFSRDTVEIDDFTDSRPDNFAQADKALAERYNNELRDGRNNWSSADIENMRKEQNLTWHERSDMKTMDLVPSEIHNNIPHSGGISAAKQLAI